MDFKFNFGGEDNAGASQVVTPAVPEAPGKQILHDPSNENIRKTKRKENISTSTRPVETISFKGKNNKESSLKKYAIRAGEGTGQLSTITNHSDLEPGVYEGGFKLWECAVDLINHFLDINIDFTNKKVLELGCGHGLPGIYAIDKGAEWVYFQDYNEEVISDITIPNVFLNSHQNGLARSQFYSGDWAFVDELLGNLQFDVILTADTLYAPSSYPKLYNIIKRHLAPGGLAYIAAKKYYFGVSGSTHLFLSEIKEKSLFNIKSVDEIRDGVSNVREIICLSH